MKEKFVYVVTDNWRKISRNITNSLWSAQQNIDDLTDRVILAGHEVIMSGIEEIESIEEERVI